jgi:hypothetical protein
VVGQVSRLSKLLEDDFLDSKGTDRLAIQSAQAANQKIVEQLNSQVRGRARGTAGDDATAGQPSGEGRPEGSHAFPCEPYRGVMWWDVWWD